MTSPKGRFVRMLSSWVLEDARVASVEPFGKFRRLQLQCDLQSFSAGTKLQLLLPSDDMRTYTPIATSDGIALLGWAHGDGPGARWLLDVKPGDAIAFMGPGRSLQLAPGPVVLVGDETSVAVAAALATERPGQVRAVIQSPAASDVREAAASVGLSQLDVVAPGDTHATVEAVTASLSGFPDAVVALTGCSEIVKSVRDALRTAGVRKLKTRTYWIPGRTGLD